MWRFFFVLTSFSMCVPLGGLTPSKLDTIDVISPTLRFETEPIELNPDADLESETWEKDYNLEPLPSKEPLPKLDFVSPGAGNTGHAVKIRAKEGEAGMLSTLLKIDKGQRMTFSINIRANRIRSAELVATPIPVWGRKTLQVNSSPYRSKVLSGTFDWTTLSFDTLFTSNIDRVIIQVVVRGSGTVWIDNVSVKTHWPKIQPIPKEPKAPLLFMVLMHSETPKAYITNEDFFRKDAIVYEEYARMLNRYGGCLVAEPEREIWLGAKKFDPGFIRRLHEEYGVSFSVHTHGPKSIEPKEVLKYIKLRKEELEAMGSGPVTDLNGNFDVKDWDIFAEVGFHTMTAYKDKRTQRGLMAMDSFYLHPWRPSGSPYHNKRKFLHHNPRGKIIFLPGAGAVHTRHHGRFAPLMERYMRVALNRVRADKINVFYLVEHVGRFRPREGQSHLEYVKSQAFRDDLKQHEKFYRDFVAPLVESGYVRFVTPSEICDSFEEWERKMGISKH